MCWLCVATLINEFVLSKIRIIEEPDQNIDRRKSSPVYEFRRIFASRKASYLYLSPVLWYRNILRSFVVDLSAFKIIFKSINCSNPMSFLSELLEMLWFLVQHGFPLHLALWFGILPRVDCLILKTDKQSMISRRIYNRNVFSSL